VGDLARVKRWMTFYGWTNEGGPGSVKRDAGDRLVAVHKDATWCADVDEAQRASDREYARETARG